jgi:transcriptional regulator with XRE-family HTH domain
VKYAREEEFIKCLGKKIKKIRMENNLTQNQLAFEAGLTTIFRVSEAL